MAGEARDTKAIVMGALTRGLPGVDVVSTRPDGDGTPTGGPLVRVIATGGIGRHHRVLHTAQITIDTYAPSPGQAMSLALRVDAVIHALIADRLAPVTQVTGSSPAESPDPDTTAARASATYQITTRNLP